MKNVKCKNCANMVNHWCEKVLDDPEEDRLRDCQYYRTRTNGERLRQMSDEELGALMCRQLRVCHDCPGYDLCKLGDGRGNGMIKWLEQEATENDQRI